MDADASGLQPSLPSDAYRTPESFATDRRTILAREWFCTGRTDQIPAPGDHLVLDIAGESVLVVRDKAGTLYAHYNVCRHRGARRGGALQPAVQCHRPGCRLSRAPVPPGPARLRTGSGSTGSVGRRRRRSGGCSLRSLRFSAKAAAAPGARKADAVRARSGARAFGGPAARRRPERWIRGCRHGWRFRR